MFHVYIDVPKEKLESILVDISKETGIGLTSHISEIRDNACFYEVSIGDGYALIPRGELGKVFQLLDEKLREIN
jgi:hypothetical protein